MSASNWAQCPRCKANRQAAAEAAQEEARAAYGVVSVEEFDAMRAKVDKLFAEVDQDVDTFREDYEFYGAVGGEVTASYRGECTRCGLSLSFEHSHRLYPPE